MIRYEIYPSQEMKEVLQQRLFKDSMTDEVERDGLECLFAGGLGYWS